MRSIVTAFAWFLAVVPLLAAEPPKAPAEPPKINPADPVARQIEQAAPDQPIVKPAQRRKVLVYGRLFTHGDPVKHCFWAMEILGRKSGAFQAVASGDPAVFAPDSLRQFDVVLMNNTHEPTPWLPEDFRTLPADKQKQALEQEPLLQKSFQDFVASGKGLVGIHGATCSVKWPDYWPMIGGKYGAHIAGKAWVKAEQPAHPLCAGLDQPFTVNDEIYLFAQPYSREKLRVLTALDLSQMEDPKKRPDKDYAVSWVQPYGKGRVFYCSLGHAASTYHNPQFLRHVLAGIQYAAGDLKAEDTPVQAATPKDGK